MIQAGFAKIDYTPEPGVRFGRLGINAFTSEGVKSPLMGRMVVFDDGQRMTDAALRLLS